MTIADPNPEAPPPPPSKTYQGSCHCGAVRFQATLSPPLESQHMVYSCNCSICTRNGYLMVHPKIEDVIFEQGEDSLTTYQFHTKRVAHKFCPVCGTSVCIDFTGLDIMQGKMAVNVRTLDGVDLEKLELNRFDGRNEL